MRSIWKQSNVNPNNRHLTKKNLSKLRELAKKSESFMCELADEFESELRKQKVNGDLTEPVILIISQAVESLTKNKKEFKDML